MDNFYVYLHRRESEGPEGTPFYVGKGHGKRAYSRHKRNTHWKRVVAKHGFTVDIIESNLSEQSAFELEVALIAKYGRENLCNMTSGGEGKSGYKFESAIKNKAELLEYVQNTEEPPVVKSKLGRWYFRYARAFPSTSHDPIFAEEVYKLRPEWREKTDRRSVKATQTLVVAFIAKNKYIPSSKSKDVEERRLGLYCRKVQCVNTAQFSQEFSDYLETKVMYKTYCANKRKELVKKFCLDNTRAPSRYSKDKEERRLHSLLGGYSSTSNTSYDPDFRQWMIDKGFLSLRELREDHIEGVSFEKSKGKWRSRISINGKPIDLGTFPTQIEAQEALERYLATQSKLQQVS